MPAKKKPAAKKSSRRPAKRAARKAAAPKRTPRKQPESLRLTDIVVSITVNDLMRSRDWYRDLLGFTVAEEWKSEGQVLGMRLVAGRSTIMLGQDDFKKGRDRVKGVGSRLYLITTQDVDALADRVKARGQALDSGPLDQEWGAREFAVTDPDGFKLTIGKWKSGS
ncbi:MAG TPA: VOC family protein [Gemmatimonadales bacterium]|nr:VOC family protein [Gemmatimonadales bacterium]